MHRCILLALVTALSLSTVGCFNGPTNPNLPCLVGVHNATTQSLSKITIDNVVVAQDIRAGEQLVVSGTYLTGSYHRIEIHAADTTSSAFRGAFSVPWSRRYNCASTAVGVLVRYNPPNGVTIYE